MHFWHIVYETVPSSGASIVFSLGVSCLFIMDLDLIISSGEKGFWNESILGVLNSKSKRRRRNSITRKTLIGLKTIKAVNKRPRPKSKN